MFPLQIGRYEIKNRIGRGGMGDLYLARDPNTNRLVALKLLNATLDSSEIRERFAREARALAALNHPNIVSIYDTGEFDDSPFIVMEYVRGETLAEMIKRRAVLSIPEKLKLMEELCAGLAQAHEAGIIHRDIKPANLMVDQLKRLKILDFGIARVAEGNRTRVGPLTQVNMMIGTPGYMSPEQIEDGQVDHRSDIFAVGAVCYELLSYGEAFAGTNTRQIESSVLRGQPAPLASRVPGLDPEIDQIVFRALKRDPNKRYQDATTFEKALERLRARLGPSDAQGPLHRPTPPLPARGGGGRSRADAAYQRSVAAQQGSAPEAARRFALEALAEDPSHEGARAFLTSLEQRMPWPVTQTAPSPEPASSTVVGTSVGGTAVGTPAGRTAVSTAVGKGASTMASAPTIIAPPASARSAAAVRPAARWKRYQALWSSDGPLRRGFEQLWKRDRTPGKAHENPWTRYRPVAQAVALLVIVALIVTALVRFAMGPSGQLLTITKPVGGTLSTAGILCGTRGANCSTSRPKGDAIELTPEADAGFAFAGYTGDCAPGGRTVMAAARTCGATFSPVVAVPPPTTQLLTIAPVPMGGTIEGVDIICGTKGSICSANHPDGVPVELHPTPDPGFTFMGFLGDCAPLGHTQMTGPRTCGATFSLTSVVSAIPSQTAARRAAPPQAPPASPPASASATTPELSKPRPSSPPPPRAPALPGAAPVVDASAAAGKPVEPPPTDAVYAKGKIQEVLKEYCDAFEAINPEAVQRVYPKVPLDALKIQLNGSKYKSVQCKFGDPVFVSLDPLAGTAKVQAELKRVYEHTILTEKPQTSELIAVITMFRSALRSPWLIDSMTYKQK